MIIFGLLVAALIIFGVSTTIKPSTGIKFIVVPDKITAKIDGKNTSVSYESTVSTKTGTLTVELSKEGFESKTQTVEVKDGEVSELYVYLKPLTEAAEKEVASATMQQRISRIGGFVVAESAQKLEKEYPFVPKLPIFEKYFTITSCSVDPDDSSVLGICVNLAIDEPFYREQAVQSMKDNDIDPTKWEVVYGNQFTHTD